MKKLYFATACAMLAVGGMNAQTVNRALEFTSEGTVNCGAMPQLNKLDSYSLQFWMMPDNWTEGATLLHRGDNFSVKLGADNIVVINNGENSVTAQGFVPKEWNQVTLIVNKGAATVLVNSQDGGSGTLGALDETKRAFIMGGGYEGLLDEVRVWNAPLNDQMKTFDYFTNNTLNKWNPMWENLVAYYKMDQENCPNLVEYKIIEEANSGNQVGNDNHGVMSSGVKRVVASNDKMPYLLNAAYTENSRFNDRLIPREAYLLSNEIIILGADCVSADGSIKLRTPNNHATVHGGITYVASKGVRNGVIELDGKPGTYLEAPAESLHFFKAESTQANPTNQNLNTYTFETRVYVDEWQPGAYLFRKESDDQTRGVAIMLGDEEGTLKVRINGKVDISPVLKNFTPGKWNHVALVSNPNGEAASNKTQFYANGGFESKPATAEISNLIQTENVNLPVYIGEGLKGWLDMTFFSNTQFGSGMLESHTNNDVPVPGVDRYRNNTEYNSIGFLYNYDNPDNLGYSSISQDAIRDQILAQYEGYTKPNIVMSVRGFSSVDRSGSESAYDTMMKDPSLCKVFAEQLAEISKGYDGVELDLEWVYNASDWQTYHKNISEAIIAALPAGKTFRISTHNVSYSYPKDGINNAGITGFTFQQYGNEAGHYSFNGFKDYVQKFLNYGYPKDKIVTSYSTTTSKVGTSTSGVGRNNSNVDQNAQGALKQYVPGDQDTDTYNGYTYMGPMQVYNRAKYTRENNLSGIFYWDMGNDDWEGSIANDGTKTVEGTGMTEYNMAKYCSYGINANIDPIVNTVVVNHSDTEDEPVVDEPGDDGNGNETEDPGNNGGDDENGDNSGDDENGDNTGDDENGDNTGDENGDNTGDENGDNTGDDENGDNTGDENGDNTEEGDTSAVDSLESNEYVDVYSITGVLVKKNVNKAELNNVLEKGVYIVNRKKILVK